MYRPVIEKISQNHLKAFFLDTNSFFCSDKGCRYTENGTPYFRDTVGHLTRDSATKVVNYFLLKLQRMDPTVYDRMVN